MHVLDANEIFGMTFYTADKIMEAGGKNGPDALALYIRLLKQSRIQETNQTWSLNEFLQKSLGRGRDRLQNAKKVLNDLGLIDYLQLRDEQGRIQTQYVRVNYLINEQKIRTNNITYDMLSNQLTAKPADGETTTNAYIHNINAGRNKNKKVSKNQTSVGELVEACMKDDRINTTFAREDIEERLAYKEKKKQLYSTVQSCIQQLVIAKRQITLGQPKLDISKRFNFAVNYAIGKGRDGIHWYEDTEKEYLATKKDFYPNPNLNE